MTQTVRRFLQMCIRDRAKTGKYDAVIALGTVIRGGTAHFEYVAGGCLLYTSLIVVIVIGLLYALPNLFGEDPAVQITGARGVAASEQTLIQVCLLYTSCWRR